jgi:hypothetical protein
MKREQLYESLSIALLLPTIGFTVVAVGGASWAWSTAAFALLAALGFGLASAETKT